MSNDFYEIKSLTKKIGTNRRLLSRKTEFEFVRPYDLIPKYLPAVAEKAQEGRAFCEARPAEGGASEQTLSPENLKCLDWSECRESNPTYMHPMHAYCRYTTLRKFLSYPALTLHHIIFCALAQCEVSAGLHQLPPPPPPNPPPDPPPEKPLPPEEAELGLEERLALADWEKEFRLFIKIIELKTAGLPV